MEYLVHWPAEMVDRLMEFHLSARSSKDTIAINAALAFIEDVLLRRSLYAGESREGRRRVIFEPPIQVTYDVFPEERSALVVDVIYRPRKD